MSTPEKLYKKHNHWAFSPDNYSENDDIYILKSTADKEREKILRPIRHVMKIVRHYPVEGRAMLEDAIKETLERNDG